MYAIVEFLIDKTVEVAPTNWINESETECLWPTFMASKLSKAVKSKWEPKDNFEKFAVRVLYRIESYDKAREKLKKSVDADTSDLQTDQEQENKRKRKPNPRFAEKDGNDNGLSDEDNEVVAVKKGRAASKITKPPRPPTFPQRNNESAASFSSETSPGTLVSPGPTFEGTLSFSSEASPGPPVRLPEPSLPTPRASQKPTLVIKKGQVLVALTAKQYEASVKEAASPAERLILTGIEELKLLYKDLDTRLDACLRKLDANSEGVEQLPDSINLPVGSVEELHQLEEQLDDQATRRALLGGRDLKTVIRKIMHELMTDALASHFNWLGRGSKQGFADLRLHKVLKAATRKNSLFTEVTDHDIAETAKNWIKYAHDRSGGRKLRAEKERAKKERAEKKKTEQVESDSDYDLDN